jgi:hypothetical protein
MNSDAESDAKADTGRPKLGSSALRIGEFSRNQVLKASAALKLWHQAIEPIIAANPAQFRVR